MRYGLSRTQTGPATVAHIVRDDAILIARCGVKLTFDMESLAGWNLCIKCQEAQ